MQINDPHMYGIKYDIINYICEIIFSMNTHINIIDYYYEEIKTGKSIWGIAETVRIPRLKYGTMVILNFG